jgi:hypothetical protein
MDSVKQHTEKRNTSTSNAVYNRFHFMAVKVFWDVLPCRLANSSVSKYCSAFMCRVMLPNTRQLIDPEDEGTI